MSKAKKTTEHASSAFPTIIQSDDGSYLAYDKFGAGGPRDTIELIGRFRSRAAAERALRRVACYVVNAAVAVGGLA